MFIHFQHQHSFCTYLYVTDGEIIQTTFVKMKGGNPHVKKDLIIYISLFRNITHHCIRFLASFFNINFSHIKMYFLITFIQIKHGNHRYYHFQFIVWIFLLNNMHKYQHYKIKWNYFFQNFTRVSSFFKKIISKLGGKIYKLRRWVLHEKHWCKKMFRF